MKNLHFTIALMLLTSILFGQENSLHLDGTNDYVNCGNNASLQITGTTITLEAWIYPTSFKTNVWEGNVINKSGAGDNGYMLRVGNSGQVNFNIGTGSWNEINSGTGAVTLNNWHHIAGTYDGTTMRLYVDGIQVATGGLTANIGSASASLYLGDDPTWTGRYFPGRIEEVRIWNETRSAAEVVIDMNNQTCTPLPSNLVAYYRFNQGTAGANNAGVTTVNDETGTNNGTLNNSSLNGTNSNWVAGIPAMSCAPVLGDLPCNAYSLTVGCSGGKIIGDNTGMTNSSIANPSCATYAGSDVWFSAVVPASGTLKIETYALTLSDLGMSVYSTSGGCSGTFTELFCDDNSGFGNMPEITLNGQTPGNTLYIRVWDKNNNQTGTFEIDATDLSSNYCVTGNGVDQGNGCAQLTSATNNQLGSIWDADDRFDFTSDWTYDFTVNLGNSDAGADGICFVIQNDPAGLSANGTSGGAMGAGGISNSLIIEIDTYLNTEDRNDGLTGVLCSGGPAPDHLDIWLNGDVNPGSSTGCPGIGGTRYITNAVNLLSGGVDYNIENGLDHTLRISYVSGTQTLTATILNAAATVTYGTVSYSPLNPMTLFGTNAPYFGFTGSTGGLNNQQSACLAATLVLPITLTRFEAICNNSKVSLEWTTASETNNDYFTIEKSIDMINWETVGEIAGSGNSNTNINYKISDASLNNETTYYRLKQTDFNGAYSFSNVVTKSCSSLSDLTIYPNPSKGLFTFEFLSSSNETLNVMVYSLDGKILNHLSYTDFNEGKLKQEINLSELSNGVYFVSFSTNEKKITRKISIIH